jgi:hypothetical protein
MTWLGGVPCDFPDPFEVAIPSCKVLLSELQNAILEGARAGLVGVVEISPSHEALHPSVSGVQSQGTGRSTVEAKV